MSFQKHGYDTVFKSREEVNPDADLSPNLKQMKKADLNLLPV